MNYLAGDLHPLDGAGSRIEEEEVSRALKRGGERIGGRWFIHIERQIQQPDAAQFHLIIGIPGRHHAASHANARVFVAFQGFGFNVP